MKTLLTATAALALFGIVPAFADSYYIIREKDQKECRVVRERPTVGTTVVIGKRGGYVTEDEARGELKTVCVDR
jgi:hypothetical protein